MRATHGHVEVREMERSFDTLTSLCLQQVSKSVSDVGYCSLEEIAVLPTQLLLDLAPLLSAGNLAVLHPIFLRKGVSVQHHWQKLNRDVFKRDKRAQQCAFHDPSFAQEDWRQIFLDKTCQQKLQAIEHCKPEELQQQHDIQSLKVQSILHNPFYNPSDDVISRKGKPLEDYFPSSLRLESRLLPYIQANPVSMYSLQRNLKELVLSHYLPKYKQVLKTFLEHLIHGGVLRKLTLKHPKCLTPGELFSILEVCAGRRVEDVQDSIETRRSCKRKINNEASSYCNGTKQGCLKKHDTGRIGSSQRERVERIECTDNRTLDIQNYGSTQDDRHRMVPKLGEPTQTEEIDSRQDLYDFCFAEPIRVELDLSKSPQENNNGGSIVKLDPPFPSWHGIDLDEVKACDCDDGVFRLSQTTHCIQHLVLCSFMLQELEYSDMFQRALSLWPGLQELEFVDNLMYGESSQKMLEALSISQRHTQSLRRLRFEENSIQDCNLPALRHLMLSSNLETLELQSTDFEFLSDAESVNGSNEQLLLDEIAEAFSQLRTINLSQNKLRSLLYLERALLHPNSNITHLALESCQLTTEMLDVFFLHVKDSPSLRELNVNFNTYTPGRTGQLSGLVQLLQSNKLTKLDLVGCEFNLQGWIHANDFITALRNNLSLRQLGLALNILRDRCLQLFAEVFVCRSPDTPENGILTPRLCFDISNNFQVTYEGLEAFFRTLHHASKTPGLRVNPPCHLITSMAKYHHHHSDSEYLRVAKALGMTITEVENVQHRHFGEGGRINFENLMVEHLSQM
ncbi:uncharacterized protein [Asterias amurensis]|uniref:uncharacterized protein n=1 Tax=Asterias amurensis TaxID=7602 RepID=UPI003AB8C22D